jgi:hypothetical protein
MSTNKEHPTIGEKAVLVIPGNYQPIHLQDTVGAIFLGIFALIFFIGWRRAEARYRALINQQELTNGNHSLDAR